ncbi:portal protein [Hafnia phage yong3]|nr:portal protein [Hafnia phage yong3]
MGIDTKHPLYDKWIDKWIRLDDVYEGEDKIKAEGLKYLPALPSMILDGMESSEMLGYKRWELYRLRANFPDDFSEAIMNNLGLMHQKPASISLPAEMEYMMERCTSQGESMLALLRRINEMQLRHGRVGLLLDLPASESVDNRPYIAVYDAKTIINWDDGRDELGATNMNMVVLDESGLERVNDFSWKEKKRYRVLQLGEMATDEPTGTATYKQHLFEDDLNYDASKMITPTYKGEPLTEIPFQIINTTDITADPETPPLLGLANICLSMYRSDADYRQNLYMQGQDTLVIVGGQGGDDKAPQRIGAGAVVNVALGGDAKYVGVTANGLSEQRLALAKDKEEAQIKAGQMLNTTKGTQESGEAMKTRIAARTANLIRIAYTGAAGLENLLRICAKWMGLNPEEVVIKPNTEFAKSMFNGQDFVQVMTARNLKAPLSIKSIHTWLMDQGMTTLDFEEELKQIDSELDKFPYPTDATADLNVAQQGKTKPAEKEEEEE